MRLRKSTSTIMKYRIGIITASPDFAGAAPVVEGQLKLVHLLESLSEETVWVTTNCASIKQRLPSKTTMLDIDFPYYLRQQGREGRFLTRLLFFLLHQTKIVFALFKLRKRLDILVFACGADLYAFPILFGKLLRKTIILRSDGSPSGALKEYYAKSNKRKIALFKTVEKVSYLLVDKLLPESECMVNLYNLHRYQNKIGDGSLYIHAPFLRRSRKLAKRAYQVGYIGSFSRRKGVLEFTQSLLLVAKQEHIQAIMIGDGDLKNNIKQILVGGDIQDKVKLTGWIQNRELPSYLSDIKTVVVPSYMEGLPNLVLEAMGCGCIVIATPVGGIPDVVKDSETGFIMEGNSPEYIAKSVMRALNHPNLEQIAQNACALIKNKYTYEAAIERYRKILMNLRPK